MERLSGLDASFLYLESETQPHNVSCVLELDSTTMPGGYAFDRFRDRLLERIEAIPEFRYKLADSTFNLDHPVWVTDEDFTIERHLHRAGLPSPGGRAELEEVCGKIIAGRIDRDHPLWQMWVIDGLEDPTALAVIVKAHHAVVDGVGGANLIAQLCGLVPDAPTPEVVGGPGPANGLQLFVSGLFGIAKRPLRLASVVPATVASVAKTVYRARRGGRTMASPLAAPPTLFNGSFTNRRTVALAEISLDDVKTIKNRFGVTVNDTVLAVCAGALRTFLLDRDALPEVSLVANVPISMHDKSERPGRNQATMMFCRLETHIDDAVERLLAVAEGASAAKDHAFALGSTLMQDWTEFGGQTMFGAAMKLVPRLPAADSPSFNLVVSNLPGPPIQLYFLGSEVRGMYPLGPIIYGAGLNITFMSLNGRIGIGMVACPDLLPDLSSLAQTIPRALEELLQCAA